MSEDQIVTSPEVTPLRRRPVQQRSVKRVERMLDASAELLEDMDYEALTTTLIAQRAGVAVGSLYQFFPDKRAVVQALMQRNLDRFITAVQERLHLRTPQHWWDVVDALLDVYLQMYRQVPGFSKVHFRDAADMRLLDDHHTNRCALTDSLLELLASHVDLAPEEATLVISIVVEAADGLFNLAFRLDPNGEPRVITETKTLIKGYLAGKFGK